MPTTTTHPAICRICSAHCGLIATITDEHGSMHTLGVVRAIADPDNETAEFAVALRSDQKGRKLGRLLMERIIAYARARGTRWPMPVTTTRS